MTVRSGDKLNEKQVFIVVYEEQNGIKVIKITKLDLVLMCLKRLNKQ